MFGVCVLQADVILLIFFGGVSPSHSSTWRIDFAVLRNQSRDDVKRSVQWRDFLGGRGGFCVILMYHLDVSSWCVMLTNPTLAAFLYRVSHACSGLVLHAKNWHRLRKRSRQRRFFASAGRLKKTPRSLETLTCRSVCVGYIRHNRASRPWRTKLSMLPPMDNASLRGISDCFCR